MHLFQNIYQRYSNLRLQSKFLLALILLVMIPALFVGNYFFTQLYDLIISDTVRKEQTAASETVPDVEKIISEIHDASISLSELDFYQQLFFQPLSEEPHTFLAGNDAILFEQQVENLIDNTRLSAVRIYLDMTSLPSRDQQTGSIFDSTANARTYWHGIFRSSSIKELYCPPSYLGVQEKKLYGDAAYIRATTFYYEGEARDAYIVCYYSTEEFRTLLTQSLTLADSVSYLVNDRDEIITTTDDALAGTYLLSYSSIEKAFMSSNNFVQRTIVNQDVYAAYYNIAVPGWFMVTVLPEKPMLQIASRIILQLLAVYGVFLIIAILLAVFLSRSITGRISAVINQMHRVRYGPPTPIESPTQHDEVGELIDTYNYMTEKMNVLIEKQAQAAEDLRIAEFNSLQAQINPHFLYNTMDMINWMAQQGQTEEISEAVQSLSRFYKLTLSRKNSISTIANEAEHISIYVHIQNMRFHDQIDLVLDIPDEFMDYTIPKLTLQPVVENAILHGILESESKSGTIVVTGWREGEDIVLLISDDGVGIPTEKLSSILKEKTTSSNSGSNIAIYNTHRRLQILYGDGYGLTYQSRPGEGTEVEIRIPAIRKD